MEEVTKETKKKTSTIKKSLSEQELDFMIAANQIKEEAINRRKEERRQEIINDIAELEKSYKIQCLCIAGQAICFIGLLIVLIIQLIIL